MKNIAIIGVGNIGRRHLQALTNLDPCYSLYVVDPVKDVLDLSMKMYKEVKKRNSPELQSVNNIRNLPSRLYTAIVATNSDQRYSVTKTLLEKEVQYIIFEKILFQNPNEYFDIEKRLKNKNIKSWVNCWRRAVPFYQELNKKINNKKIISLNVKGNKWELASSVIHFIDLISYLCRSTEYHFSNCKVKIIPSKRNGFKELFGEIKGLFHHQLGTSTFSLLNSIETDLFEITLRYDDKILTINDGKGWWIEKKVNGKIKKGKIKIPLQSQITHTLINDLTERGKCDLTAYEESRILHLPMIEYFTSIFQNSGINGCPIT